MATIGVKGLSDVDVRLSPALIGRLCSDGASLQLNLHSTEGAAVDQDATVSCGGFSVGPTGRYILLCMG